MPITWVEKAVVLALHDEQILEHGGQPGLRDEGLFDTALMRPINRENCESVGIAELAAAYGYGITRNHLFLDGNKRTSLVVTELFLYLNGFSLIAENASCLEVYLMLAEGTINEKEFETWVEENIVPNEQRS